MKTKLKKILSITLPLVGLTASAIVAAPMIVSCSNNSGEPEKPQTPSTPGSGGNGGGITTPETKPPVNLEYFNIEKDIIDEYYTINGLKGEGLKQTSITFPAEYNGLSIKEVIITQNNSNGNELTSFHFEKPSNIIRVDFSGIWRTRDFDFDFTQFTSLEYIKQGSFKNNTKITTLDLSKTKVHAISIEAFMGCSNLTNVIWPNANNLIINERAFSNTNINNTSISTLATKNIKGISNEAFSNNANITAVNWSSLSDSVTTLGSGIFSGCSELTDIKVKQPSGKVWEIGNFYSPAYGWVKQPTTGGILHWTRTIEAN